MNSTTDTPLLLHRISAIKAYEMTCLNLSTHITHYRLRSDGALVLVDNGEINCVTCHVPESLGQEVVRAHLNSRANSIRKVLRDRRIVVEIGSRTCVYSSETLQRRNVLMDAHHVKTSATKSCQAGTRARGPLNHDQ